MNFKIEPMTPADWKEVKHIYADGIATGLANFYENTPSWKAWNKNYLEIGRLVARNSTDNILGWAALSPVGGN
ncbi:MAG: L-amino acid N-acyltransferase YncA [Candidatus Promineifilaceae bacterium]|jgi:L-amino acid N-acyltransferase YncA